MFRIAFASVAAFVAGILSAHADQIGISGATGFMTFVNTTDPLDKPLIQGPIDFTTSGFAGIGTATFQSPTGVVKATGDVKFGPMSGGLIQQCCGSDLYAIVNQGPFPGESFSYKDNANSLTGYIDWGDLKDHTNTPQFDVNSTLTVTSSSGNPIFVDDFAVGSHAEIDMTILLGTSMINHINELDTLICDTISGAFSTAEIIPSVSEPGPLSVILISCIMLFLATRGRARKLGLPPERAT